MTDCRCASALLIRALCVWSMWLGCPGSTLSQQTDLIRLEVGSSKLINSGHVTRVAVGDSQVIQATAVDNDGLLIFGKTKGVTTVDIWSKKGRYRSYLISVSPRGLHSNYLTVQEILKNSPAISVSIAGDKIILEGDEINDHERQRINEIMKRFPDVVDFTSTIGWDKMILLDVQVIELPSAKMEELGLKWGSAGDEGVSTGIVWNVGKNIRNDATERSSYGLEPLEHGVRGVIGVNAFLNARIAMLSQQGEAVILAQPQLMTRSGSTATFLAGGEVPYSTIDKNGQPHTIFKNYGVNLSITPHTNRYGTVRSKIEIEVSSVDSSIMSASGPALRTRKAATEFNVKSGQTFVLGGFLSREKSHENEGIPGISQLPLIGDIFQTKRAILRQTELAILVTPIVLDARLDAHAMNPQTISAVIDGKFTDSSIFNSKLQIYEPQSVESILSNVPQGDQWEALQID